LLNPLIISLFAIIPHQSIGIVAITMSFEGLVNTLGMLFAYSERLPIWLLSMPWRMCSSS